jgi:hypothetical protein
MSNKNVQAYLQKMAEDVGGKYTEYSDNSVIVTLPLDDGRYQNVKGYIHQMADGLMLVFMSKVCHLNEVESLDCQELLKMNAELCYAKTAIDDGFLEIIATTRYELCSHDQVRFMIFEVANVADSLEKQLTGLDVN